MGEVRNGSNEGSGSKERDVRDTRRVRTKDRKEDPREDGREGVRGL